MRLACVERLIIVILRFVLFFDVQLNVVALLKIIKIIIVSFAFIALIT